MNKKNIILIIFIIAAVIFLVYVQLLNLRTVNILQKVEQIDDVENSYRTGYAASAQLEERYGIVSDHGLEVKSFLKGDQVYKIIESVGLSYGTFEYEYYFWEGEFIYAKVTEKNFAKQDTGLNYEVLELAFEGGVLF